VTKFTFITREAQSGLWLATNDLLDSSFTMPPATAAHVIQIFEELTGAELAALPYTHADIHTSGDPFEDRHGVPGAVAEDMFYVEHVRPHLVQRGCTLIEGTARYFDTILKESVAGTPDVAMLSAASSRIMEVHLVHVHNIPASELEDVADLIEHHQELLEEFYGACAERPLPTVY